MLSGIFKSGSTSLVLTKSYKPLFSTSFRLTRQIFTKFTDKHNQEWSKFRKFCSENSKNIDNEKSGASELQTPETDIDPELEAEMAEDLKDASKQPKWMRFFTDTYEMKYDIDRALNSYNQGLELIARFIKQNYRTFENRQLINSALKYPSSYNMNDLIFGEIVKRILDGNFAGINKLELMGLIQGTLPMHYYQPVLRYFIIDRLLELTDELDFKEVTIGLEFMVGANLISEEFLLRFFEFVQKDSLQVESNFRKLLVENFDLHGQVRLLVLLDEMKNNVLAQEGHRTIVAVLECTLWDTVFFYL
jgi:hypothetical protein